MAKKRLPGMFKRGQVWHIDKYILGTRIRESTGERDLKAAEKYLIKKIEVMREASIYGVRPKRCFRHAAIKYLNDHQHKRSIAFDACQLKVLDPYIGELSLEMIHMGTLETFIKDRRLQGCKNKTINHSLAIVRRILNLAATLWRDQFGLTWLVNAPKIQLLSTNDARKPHPLSWDEQKRLLQYLPEHLKAMVQFAVNTGCRDHEICSLRWQWEIYPTGLKNHTIFIIPGHFVKNTDDRLVVLNQAAKQVIESQRGIHPQFVFTYRGKPIKRMLNSAFRRARKLADINVRVHDLKHTFGRRLRAAGVSFEDRQDLLGHKSKRITTHYSAPEISNLIIAADKILSRTTLLMD